MSLFKQKKVAMICCAVLVLIAAVFGCYRSLSAVRRDALDVYTNGDENGLSILANLNSIGEYASTLIKTAGGCYSADDAVYADVQAAYQALLTCQGTDAEGHRKALTDLMTACTLLQADYEGRSDIDKDTVRLMNRSINDIISMKDQIRHSAYNALATDFNNALGGFPAGLMAGLTGIKPLPLF